MPSARCRLCSRFLESMVSIFLQGALKRMLVLACEVHHLGDLGLGHLIREDPANADAPLVHVQHDSGRILSSLSEKPFDELIEERHRRKFGKASCRERMRKSVSI